MTLGEGFEVKPMNAAAIFGVAALIPCPSHYSKTKWLSGFIKSHFD
jgi:hypothetical protein